MSAYAGSRDQVGRMLALVPYLNARGSVHVDEAARDLGVTPQQIVKDLRVLFLCGLPGGYPDDLIDVDISALTEKGGDGVIRMSNADYLDRPLRLSPTEASALIVALRALSEDPATTALGEQVRSGVDSALAKLEAAIGSAGDRIAADDPAPRLVADRLWHTVEEALGARRQLRIAYHVPARDEVVERVVDPWALTRQGQVAYLRAWCHNADDTRSFRLDRIVQVDLLDSPIDHPAPETVGASDATGAGAAGDVTDADPRPDGARSVTVLLSPQARWIPDYYRTEAVRPRPDGSAEGRPPGCRSPLADPVGAAPRTPRARPGADRCARGRGARRRGARVVRGT